MARAFSHHHSAGWLAAGVAFLIAGTAAFAESDYEYQSVPPGPFHPPVAPYPVEMGFSQDHSSTLAEGAQRGRAAVIQAWGNYELSTSQAAILRQQARWLDRENDLKYVQARLAWKEMLRDARLRAREQRETAITDGQKKLAARQATDYRIAYQLSADELDPVTGTIHWPAALQHAKFRSDRERVNELMRQLASYGDAQSGAAHEVVRCTDRLIRGLRVDSQVVPRDQYLAAQKFLRGLKCEAEALSEAV